MADWNSKDTVIDIQFGGPGNPWRIWDIGAGTLQSGMLSGPSGGGRDVTDRFARDIVSGRLVRTSVVPDGNPERITFNLSKRLRTEDFREYLRRFDCQHSVRVRQKCANGIVRTNFEVALHYAQTFGTGYSYPENLANPSTDETPDIMVEIAESASEELRLVKLSHLNISGSVSDVVINKVIAVGYPQCAGACGDEQTGNESFWAVTAVDATPGYLSVPTPRFLWTENEGASWSGVYVNGAANASATDVLQVGEYAVVATTGGVYYARYSDIRAGVVNPFSRSTGTTTSFHPTSLATPDGGSTIWAVGPGGYIYKSTDGALSFTVVSAGSITGQALTRLAFADANLGYAAGAGGAFLAYSNGSWSLLPISGVTGSITALAQPSGQTRGREVYIAHAGNILRSKDKGVTWTTMTFDQAGSGTIEDLRFVGYNGEYLFVIQTAANGKSRVLRDLSGGALAQDVEIISSYDQVANSGINSIAPSDQNYAITVGDLNGGFGFIGKVA